MMARRLAASAVWSISSRLLCRVVDLVTLLVLARLLAPADFGIVAVAMTLVSILEAVLELPISTVLLCKPELEAADFDTAFTLAALRGLALGGLALILAFPFAWFYGDPKFPGLIAVLSLAPMARGLQSPRMVEFAKALNFRSGFLVDVTGRLVAGLLAALVALLFRDRWAIVVSTVAGPVATTLASYVIAAYRPHFSLARWSAFRHFLGWSSAAQLVGALNWQCDRLLLGRLVPPTAMGQFSMASDLSLLPNQSLILPLMTPTLSAFQQISADRNRLRGAYERSVSAMLAIGLPALVGLSLTAKPLVALLLGGKWNAASGLLQWLALESVPYLFSMPAWPLAMALGRVRLLFHRNVIELMVKIPLLVGTALAFGIPGVVASRIIMAVVIAGVSMHMTRGLIGISIRAQLGFHWRTILACAVMAAAVMLVKGVLPEATAPAIEVAIEAFVGAAVYGAAMLLLGFDLRGLLKLGSPAGVVQASAD